MGLTLEIWILLGVSTTGKHSVIEVCFQQVDDPTDVPLFPPASWSLDVIKDLEEQAPRGPTPTSLDRTLRGITDHQFFSETKGNSAADSSHSN